MPFFSALQCTEKSHGHPGAKKHGAAVKKHGAAVKKHGAVVKKHGAVVKKHGAVVKKVAAAVKKHGAVVKKHGAAAKKHVAAAKKKVVVKKSGFNTYHLVNMNKSWRDAEHYCSKTSYRHLVVIKDAKSQQALDSYLKSVGGQ